MDEMQRGLDEPTNADMATPHIDVRRAMMIAFLLTLVVAWVVLLRVVH